MRGAEAWAACQVRVLGVPVRVGKGLTVEHSVPENGAHCYLVNVIEIQTPSLVRGYFRKQ